MPGLLQCQGDLDKIPAAPPKRCLLLPGNSHHLLGNSLPRDSGVAAFPRHHSRAVGILIQFFFFFGGLQWMLVFVMLGKALWGGGRETQAALSVVVRKGRKMLKQAADSLFAEMAVHTHGCRASPAARQEGQENKSPRCHCSDKSPEGTLESHSAPRKVSCVHSLPSQHTARGLPSSQELQGALEQGESCPAAHECAHAACPQRSLGITKHRAERSLGTAAAACLGQCLGFGHGVCWR